MIGLGRHYPVEFKEKPLDESGDFFGISKKDFDAFTSSDGNRPDENHIYETQLADKLKEHSVSDLEDFIEFQLGSIHDKLSWLRNLDRMVNKNGFPFFEETQNKLALAKLIPELITKYRNKKTSKKSDPQNQVTFVGIQENTTVKTKFTINELLLLFEILNLSDLIDYDHLTKEKLAEFIAQHFTSIKKTDAIKPGSVRQAMKENHQSSFQTLDDKLIQVRKYLKAKSESIG